MPTSDYIYSLDDSGNATITSYTGAGGDIIIPSTLDGHPVVAIGDKAFNEITSIISVVIPSSVTSIADFAFRGCTSLTSINIPAGITCQQILPT
jgi:hypothetical protein